LKHPNRAKKKGATQPKQCTSKNSGDSAMSSLELYTSQTNVFSSMQLPFEKAKYVVFGVPFDATSWVLLHLFLVIFWKRKRQN
jgi:hypothetical protein